MVVLSFCDRVIDSAVWFVVFIGKEGFLISFLCDRSVLDWPFRYRSRFRQKQTDDYDDVMLLISWGSLIGITKSVAKALSWRYLGLLLWALASCWSSWPWRCSDVRATSKRTRFLALLDLCGIEMLLQTADVVLLILWMGICVLWNAFDKIIVGIEQPFCVKCHKWQKNLRAINCAFC